MTLPEGVKRISRTVLGVGNGHVVITDIYDPQAPHSLPGIWNKIAPNVVQAFMLESLWHEMEAAEP
jgi:hypothetical protein